MMGYEWGTMWGWGYAMMGLALAAVILGAVWLGVTLSRRGDDRHS